MNGLCGAYIKGLGKVRMAENEVWLTLAKLLEIRNQRCQKKLT